MKKKMIIASLFITSLGSLYYIKGNIFKKAKKGIESVGESVGEGLSDVASGILGTSEKMAQYGLPAGMTLVFAENYATDVSILVGISDKIPFACQAAKDQYSQARAIGRHFTNRDAVNSYRRNLNKTYCNKDNAKAIILAQDVLIGMAQNKLVPILQSLIARRDYYGGHDSRNPNWQILHQIYRATFRAAQAMYDEGQKLSNSNVRWTQKYGIWLNKIRPTTRQKIKNPYPDYVNNIKNELEGLKATLAQLPDKVTGQRDVSAIGRSIQKLNQAINACNVNWQEREKRGLNLEKDIVPSRQDSWKTRMLPRL